MRNPGRQNEDAPQDQASQEPEAARRRSPLQVGDTASLVQHRGNLYSGVAVIIGFVVLPACAEAVSPAWAIV